MSNAIVTENQNIGTASWPANSVRSTIDIRQIAGYTDATSYAPGGTVTFYVSTQAGGTTYTITVYRLGYYQGTGGCLKWTSSNLSGVAQGYYDGATLQNNPTAITNSSGLIDANWASVATWSIPSNACTGIYVAVFTDQNGKQSFASFVVRQSSAGADYAYIHCSTTEQAYNYWGSHSLYDVPCTYVQVSYNRPNWNNDSTNSCPILFTFELNQIEWLEQQGYNVAYLDMVDIETGGTALLDNYKALLFGGHAEYWTVAARTAVTTTLTHGTGLAFLGANPAYWQMRYSADSHSTANRYQTCYKCQTTLSNLSIDPEYGVNNTLVSSQWRDPVLNLPEASFVGIQFTSLVSGTANNVPWTCSSTAPTTYFGADPLHPGPTLGASYGKDIVGYEMDASAASSPSNLQIIGATPFTDEFSTNLTCHTTYYTAPSGALVFASGSHSFCWALVPYRYFTYTQTIPQIQVLMTNIMAALMNGKAGTAAPTAHTALGRFHS